MTIKVTYNVTDVYVSESVTTTYINVSYEAPSGGSGAVWGDIIGTLSDQLDLQAALDAKVPYSGATANVDLGEYELKAGQLELDQTPTGVAGVAVTRWNDSVGTIETTLKGGSVVLKHGRDMFERVVNKTGIQLTRAAYQAVRVSDAQGQRLAVSLAQANNDNNSADTIGLVVETIDNNQEGYIYTVGEIDGVNTTGSLQGETWVDGDVLYLSPTTAGRITNVKPVAPQHLVVIGYVVYAHANNGKIYVKVMNGWELGELHDVDTTGAVNGNVLKYNGTIWTPSGDVGITSLNGLNAVSQTFSTGTSGTDFNISSATSTHTFNLPSASAANRGLLTSADWTTFNNKQNALTNPVTGTGASGQVAYWSGTGTQTGSNNLFWDNTNGILSVGSNVNLSTAFRSQFVTNGNSNFVTSAAFGNTATFRGAFYMLRGRGTQSSPSSILSGDELGQLQFAGYFGSLTDAYVTSASIRAIASANFTSITQIPTHLTFSTSEGGSSVAEKMRLTDTGRLLINSTTDYGQRLQVTGDGYFSGSVGIGTNAPSTNLEVSGGFNVTDGTTTIRAVNSGGIGLFGTLTNHDLALRTNNTQRARITAGGNFIINNSSTDNGLRFQVTGDGYFSGSVGIGSSNLTQFALRIAKNIEGSTISYGAAILSTVQSGVTSQARVFYSEVGTAAASFTLGELNHYYAVQGTFGAGSAVTNQYGFRVYNNLTGATNNYGFYGDIASGTGRWNLYMNGSAANWINGNTKIGGNTTLGSQKLEVVGNVKFDADGATNGLYWDNTNKRLGIGTNAPLAPLQVLLNGSASSALTGTTIVGQNSSSGSNSYLSLIGAFNAEAGIIFTDESVAYKGRLIYNNLTEYFGFWTDGSERMRLDASGNLGLGVTPSAWYTPTSGIAMQMTAGSLYSLSTNSFYINQNAFLNASASWRYIAANPASQYLQNAGNHYWYIAPTGTAGAAITFTQAMTLDASGNLGIGTTSPAGKLEVNGLTFINNTADTTARLLLRNSTTGASAGGLDIREIGVDTSINNVSNGNMYFSTNNSERVRIFAGGNIGIATGASDSGERLQVNGTMKVSGASTFIVNGSANQRVANFRNTGGNGYIEIQGSGSVAAQILSTALGDFYVATGGTAGTYGTTRLLIDNTGAATFSSSVTAGGAITIARGQDANVTNVNINSGVTPVSAFQINTDQPNLRSILMSRNGYSLVLGTQDVNRVTIDTTGAATFSSSVTSTQFRLSALNTAPATSSSTGTLGEIRIDADYIYICTATNTWKRVAIATW